MDKSEFVNLEDAYFDAENARAMKELARKADQAARRDALRRVVAIRDDAFLDRLIAMDIGPERAMALRLIPLIFVAWADGALDEAEREAILRAARQEGLVSSELTTRVLRNWLESPPEPRLLQLWKDYVGNIWPRFTADEQWAMRSNLLNGLKDVAGASGGFLGMGKVSAVEQALLDELKKVVD